VDSNEGGGDAFRRVDARDRCVRSRAVDYASLYLRGLGRFEEPFALVYARTSIVAPLREHHRWPELAALMNLPASAP
jgi:hypothetical protein